MKKATQQQTKEHNRNLVLSTIFKLPTTSRAEVSRLTRLTRTTVSDIVADLIAEGLVAEVGTGPSIGGKSPILLSLVDDARYMIGLDLAHNRFVGAVVNLRGEIRQTVTLPVNDRNGEDALTLVYQILDQLTNGGCSPLIGIGVGTPGLVNPSEGVVVNAVNLDWKNLPLARLINDRYHLPVYVLNDSQAAAIGEFTYADKYTTESSLVLINARHGIGSGIVLHGKLYQGDGGGAGEIGHIVVVPDGGLRCRCGNQGCLETVASARALVDRAGLLARAENGPPSSLAIVENNLEAIRVALESGDSAARQAVLETARYFGLAIAGLIGILNVSHIVLSGDMARFGEPWLAEIRQTVAKYALPRLAQSTSIELSSLSGNEVVLGASAMLMTDYSLLFSRS